MDRIRQQQLRQLAETMTTTTDDDQYALAQGVLDLLTYADELSDALEVTTEACCKAVQMVYQQTPGDMYIIHDTASLFAQIEQSSDLAAA